MIKCDLGSIVQIKNGKYKGEYFVVTKILDNNYCQVCNGKQRKLLNPKKKKVKHLSVCENNSTIKEKFINKNYVLDSEIRDVISKFIKN